MKPVVDRLENRYADKVDLFIYAEADKDRQAAVFAGEHRVQGVPTTVVVGPDGRELKRFVGATSEERIAEALDAALEEAGRVAE